MVSLGPFPQRTVGGEARTKLTQRSWSSKVGWEPLEVLAVLAEPTA